MNPDPGGSGYTSLVTVQSEYRYCDTGMIRIIVAGSWPGSYTKNFWITSVPKPVPLKKFYDKLFITAGHLRHFKRHRHELETMAHVDRESKKKWCGGSGAKKKKALIRAISAPFSNQTLHENLSFFNFYFTFLHINYLK